MRRVLACLTAAALPLVAACSSGTSSSTSASSSTATSSVQADAPAVAPYLDVNLATSALVSKIASATGQKDFTLAFLVADTSTGACSATWGGTHELTDSTVSSTISAITSAGGEAIVATGGATGTYLENVCTSSQLVTAYESALDAAGSNYLDVDMEKTITDATLTSALATLQRDRGTKITITLPVAGTSGFNTTGEALLKAVKTAGVDVTVNAMTMDFVASGSWATAMTTAAAAAKTDLAAVWTDLSDSELYAMLGVTPMIGVNDSGGTTTVAAAKTLLAWAKQQKLGFVRFWSANRDNGGCTDGTVSSSCSGISQSDYAFTTLFKGFSG